MSTDDDLFPGLQCFLKLIDPVKESKVLGHEVLPHVQGFFQCHPIPVVLGVRVREPLAIGLPTSGTARADEIVEVLLCLGEFHVSSP